MCRLGVITHVVNVEVLLFDHGDRVTHAIALACGCLVFEDHLRGDLRPAKGSIDLCFAEHPEAVLPANA